ncbi:DKNYY domain-containing protein [Phocoenobacter skyensis]|uniref:DKNYY domain-containing protein n=1 Tax=Phocoenobacter skyensis TaxID=97481 RepID=A0A1H7YTB3_9PAST|nr:DKNYY domain-containing protein [Pasteurella skyensis]MDP8080006.1 DKNYY domain-containing protein [Pasteurella skyensis]MDP8085974.1 DKNYY domain-containing protein [Pasteurella skyensis]MDP8184805.1 DKNYY domain-containing protein [Pasteurella skyensis]QLB22439.1 hypothetical protein A6B44_04170 [Pasteurella skyensis]SEM49320.1 DKNYY family protein [Pasteurella skyensis]
MKKQLIQKATKDKPYLLINHKYIQIYTDGGKVYQQEQIVDVIAGKFIQRITEIPNADPYSLKRMKCGTLKDKNNVFATRLTKNSPPETIKTEFGVINNPNAIYEYYAIPGIDGKSFKAIKEEYDTIYYQDKNAIFYGFEKMENADRESFEYLDFCYARDKNFVFCKDNVIEIDTHNFKLNNNGFIYDEKNIFHYEHQVFLDAKTFEVLGAVKGTYDGVSAEGFIFNGTFIVKDKNGEYLYDSKTNHLTNK